MAEAKQATQAAQERKQIEVTVVSNYGQHRPGETLRVDEREYYRLRSPVIDDETGKRTGWTFPVLISRADQAKLDEQRRAEEEARKRTQSEREDSEGGPGWAALEEEALNRLKADFDADLRRRAAMLQPQRAAE